MRAAKAEGLPAWCLLAAKHHARGSRFRDQSALLVGYCALHIPDSAAPLHDLSFRLKPCLPNRAKEIDFQFDRSERFLLREGARKCNAHRGISNITKNPAVQCSHGICMLRSRCQDDGRPSGTNVFHLKSNQTRDWYVVRFCSFPKVRRRGKFLITHDLSAWPSISARELRFRGIPPDDGRQDREALPFAADDSPYGCLQECWQSGWPISPSRHRNAPRLVVAPPRQSIPDDQARNREPGELSLATSDCHRRNQLPCSAAGSLPAPRRRAGLESSAQFV